jgi:hypothetical protein
MIFIMDVKHPDSNLHDNDYPGLYVLRLITLILLFQIYEDI